MMNATIQTNNHGVVLVNVYQVLDITNQGMLVKLGSNITLLTWNTLQEQKQTLTKQKQELETGCWSIIKSGYDYEG